MATTIRGAPGAGTSVDPSAQPATTDRYGLVKKAAALTAAAPAALTDSTAQTADTTVIQITNVALGVDTIDSDVLNQRMLQISQNFCDVLTMLNKVTARLEDLEAALEAAGVVTA